MTLVRYTADGGHYRVGGVGFDPGDERDVDDELAEYLEDHDDFEVLEEEGELSEAEVAEDEAVDTLEEAEEGGDGSGQIDEPDLCGTEKNDGSVCKRPAGECPYHGEED